MPESVLQLPLNRYKVACRRARVPELKPAGRRLSPRNLLLRQSRNTVSRAGLMTRLSSGPCPFSTTRYLSTTTIRKAPPHPLTFPTHRNPGPLDIFHFTPDTEFTPKLVKERYCKTRAGCKWLCPMGS